MRLKNRAVAVAGSLIMVSAVSLSLGRNWMPSSMAEEGAPPARSAASVALASLGPTTIADIAERSAPAVVNIEVISSYSGGGFGGFGGLPFNFPGFGGGGGMPGMPKMDFFFNGQRINPFDGGGEEEGAPGGGGSGGKGGAGGSGGKSGANGAPGKPGIAGKPGTSVIEGGPKPRSMQKHDTGTGFIVRADGYIVTNAHVVGKADEIRVTLNDKRTFKGKVVGTDTFSDLAVLKIDATNLPTLKMGTSTGLRPGEFAVAIGSPLGYDHTVTLGIISAVGRTVIDVNGNINFIQTDAAINPGNSGGPLLNLNGEVIGVNTAIRRDAQNIGFSIPIDIAKNVSDALIANGKIFRPWLGIQMRELDEGIAKSLGIAPGVKGIAIVGFVPGSPGKAAGLQLADVIQKIDGKTMPGPKEVKDYVQSRKVSDVLHFLVVRGDATATVDVNVGDYQEAYNKKKVSEENE